MRAFLIFLSFLLLCCWSTEALAEEIKVKYKADRVEYLSQENVFRLIGNVELIVKDITIRSDQLDYDTANKTMRSDRPFILEQKTEEGKIRTLKGTSFRYDIGLQRIEGLNVYLTIPAQAEGQEVYIQGDAMTAYEDGKRIVFTNGFYTTCNHFEAHTEGHDDEDPYSIDAVKRRATHYAIQAEILDFIQDERVIAWNAQILTFENQAFWFPFWYIPLEGPGEFKKPDIDIGQNPVEGIFTRFKGYYRWNEYHDGRWYVTAMEKKGYGLGFQHDWVAYPNSISRIYFYGLPITSDWLSGTYKWLLPPDAFSDTTQALSTQQTTAAQTWSDLVSNWWSNKFEDHDFELRHKQRLLPNTEAEFLFQDKDIYNLSAYTASRNPQRNFQLNLTDRGIFALDEFTDLNVDTDLQLRQGINAPVTNRIDAADPTIQLQEIRLSQTQNRTASVSAKIDQSNLRLRSNWSNSFNETRTEKKVNNQSVEAPTILPGSGNENWNSTMNFATQIDEKTKLDTNLVYNSNITGISSNNLNGSLQQTLQPKLTLNQNHDWGNLSMGYEDFFDLSPDSSKRSRSQIKKLPEFQLRFNPFFKDTFPIQLESTIGRYFEQEAVLDTSNLNEIGRGVFKLSLPSKEYDLGLGMKTSYSGSSFEQRFYQTLDAEYILTGRVNLKNNFFSFFVPSLTYQRTIQDLENNHSPFKSFEALGLRKTNNLTADLRLVNIPEFTMNFTGGYDYLNRRYQAIRANIDSTIGGQFTLRANTSYTPINIAEQDVGKPLQDSDRNNYIHNPWGNTIWGNLGGPNIGETLLVTDDMVGAFIPYGGRWGSTTLGMRWRNTPEEIYIGNLKTFGLESGVPNGWEIGGNIAYDFHQGRVNGLNTLLRIKMGESWLWHTEIDLTASVQPFTLPREGEEWAGLEIPFKITVRKDLHDFVLTASWDSFYQQFNLNLALLAFPFSTSDLLGNVGSLNQQVNSLSNQVQTQTQNR